LHASDHLLNWASVLSKFRSSIWKVEPPRATPQFEHADGVGRVLQRSLARISAYNWAYIFESVIVRPFESCLAGDLRVRRFVPESRDSLVSSESDSAALAPLLTPWSRDHPHSSDEVGTDGDVKALQGYRMGSVPSFPVVAGGAVARRRAGAPDDASAVPVRTSLATARLHPPREPRMYRGCSALSAGYVAGVISLVS